MRDDLIGFLLDALDADEHEKIRARAAQDPELRRQIQLCERGLKPLAALHADVAPPAGLATRTCQLVAHCAAGNTGRALMDEAASGALRWLQPAGESPGVSGGLTPNRSADWGTDLSGSTERNWTVADFVVAAGVCLAAACLFFPALVNSRYNVQLTGCQNRMRELGTSLVSYSNESGGYFPVIPPRGNLSFSGVYAPKLVSKGLVDDARVFLCPAKGSTMVLKIPALQDIAAAKGPQLVSFHRTMGGDYAYALGYVRNGHLYGIRNRNAANVAILSDAPLENLRNSSITTHARGQNVLYSDGRVAFQTMRRRRGTVNDDLFFNDRGFVRAGLHAGDLVLAPSATSPLPLASGDRMPGFPAR